MNGGASLSDRARDSRLGQSPRWTVEEFFRRQDRAARSCYDERQVRRLREVTTARAEELVLQDARWYGSLGICQVGQTDVVAVDQLGQGLRKGELSYRVAIDTSGISFVRNGDDHLRDPRSTQVLVLSLEFSSVWKTSDIEFT